MRQLVSQFDHAGSPGGVATPTCGGCCCCCCCIATVLTSATVTSMRLHREAIRNGRPETAPMVALGGALLLPVLIGLAVLLAVSEVGGIALMFPFVAIGGLLGLWAAAGSRGPGAYGTPALIAFLTTVACGAEVFAGAGLLLGGIWPIYLGLALVVPVAAGFLQASLFRRRP